MTPLAQEIVRHYLQNPKSEKYKIEDFQLADLLLEHCHCYDTTEVLDLGKDLLAHKNKTSTITTITPQETLLNHTIT